MSDDLVMDVYRLTTSFPVEERYGLTQQARRAAVSVSSNIVEGCSRESAADFRRFIEIAMGSAMELRHQLMLSKRLGFARDEPSWEPVLSKADSVTKALISFMRTLKARASGD